LEDHIKTKSERKVIHEGEFLRFIKHGFWEYVERSNCSAIVIIVPTTNDKHVILVDQYRVPVGKRVIEFPAGLVNDHGAKKKESLNTAAKRELLEETGYKATRLVKILEGPVSSGSCSDIVTVLHAHNVKKVTSGGGDHLESIVVHKVAMKEIDQWLDKMRRKGYLIEPKIYTGLYYLKSYNRGS